MQNASRPSVFKCTFAERSVHLRLPGLRPRRHEPKIERRGTNEMHHAQSPKHGPVGRIIPRFERRARASVVLLAIISGACHACFSAESGPQPTPARAEAPLGRADRIVVFSDSFHDNRNGWPKWNDTLKSYIRNGAYYLEADNHPSRGNAALIERFDNSLEDFEIELRIRRLAGAMDYGVGLVFGGLDKDSHHRFEVSGDGAYVVGSSVNGTWTAIQPWTRSEHIHTGRASNVLRLRRNGDEMALFVNNHRLYSGDYPRPLGNQLGFYTNHNAKAAIEYIVVTRDKSAGPARRPGPK